MNINDTFTKSISLRTDTIKEVKGLSIISLEQRSTFSSYSTRSRGTFIKSAFRTNVRLAFFKIQLWDYAQINSSIVMEASVLDFAASVTSISLLESVEAIISHERN